MSRSSVPRDIERLKPFADIMMPGEAEEPILSPPVRAAVFEWLAEIKPRMTSPQSR